MIEGNVITLNIPADLIAMWGDADRLAGYPMIGASVTADHMLPHLDIAVAYYLSCAWDRIRLVGRIFRH